MHENQVNKVSECNLLHTTLSPSNHIKTLNSHYSPFLNGCMNTQTG